MKKGKLDEDAQKREEEEREKNLNDLTVELDWYFNLGRALTRNFDPEASSKNPGVALMSRDGLSRIKFTIIRHELTIQDENLNIEVDSGLTESTYSSPKSVIMLTFSTRLGTQNCANHE